VAALQLLLARVTAMLPPRPPDRDSLAKLLESPDQSLVDLVDSLLDKGVVLDGELVLGLADVDLVYVRLGVLLAAADRVLPPRS
jgi:gas vesicle protein GvpA/GvpJ/GvpM family